MSTKKRIRGVQTDHSKERKQLFDKNRLRLPLKKVMKSSKVTLPAGRPYDDINKLREVNSKSNEDLLKYVSDVRGRMPVFGYPMITYSPP